MMSTEQPFFFLIPFFAFILLNLVVGAIKGRRVTTLQDYALANRDIGTGTLIVTIMATIVGAKYVTSKIVDSYEFGILVPLIHALAYLVWGIGLGWYVYPKLLRFENCYTLGDIMGKIYGPRAQMITGFLSAFTCVLFIVAQLVGVANLTTYLDFPTHILGIPSPYACMLTVGIAIMLYTVLGGMRAVSATDMLQFMLVLGGFLLIAYQVLNHPKMSILGLKGLFKTIHNDYPDHLTLKDATTRAVGLLPPITFTFTFFSPAIINRVLMGRNEAQVKQSFTGFALLYPALRFILAIIGFGLLVHAGPGKVTHVNTFKMILTYIFQPDHLFVKILLMLMLLAVIMSTADSLLNALVMVIWRDIIQTYRKPKQGQNPSEPIMKWVFRLAVSMGSLTIFIAFCLAYFKVKFISLVTFSQISLGVFAFPLIFGALGLKGHMNAFFGNVVTFAGFMIGALILLHYDVFRFFIGQEVWENPNFDLQRQAFFVVPWALLISGISFLGLHYVSFGKLAWEKWPKKAAQHDAEKSGVPLLRPPSVWGKGKWARYQGMAERVGIFFMLWHMIPLVAGTDQLMHYYPYHFFFTFTLALAFYLGLLLEKVWPSPWKKYFPLFYFLALGYCLPCYHILLFCYQPSHTMMWQLLLAMVCLQLLVEWRTFLLLTGLGAGVALLVYRLTYAPDAKGLDFDLAWDLCWALCFVVLFGFLFLRQKEQGSKRKK